ncbi:pentapeptide repeat-containing protein [Fodinicurvata sp. EGI_FJ10296]|uniref:pentapeptide repeat-containing protein n=1 Tax=Fodinicurvata sp. EGI_FJ10296 TaxID=3231908 RepID=UPI0034523091
MADDHGATASNISDLSPASENPWYVLATVYGEQHSDKIDHDLHKKNMRIWNAWSCRGMDQDIKKTLLNSTQKDRYVERFTKNDKEDIENAFRNRLLSTDIIPINTEVIHFSDSIFHKNLNMSGFIITQDIIFDRSRFCKEFNLNNSFIYSPISLDHCVFDGDSRFDGVYVGDNAEIRGATYKAQCRFVGTIFNFGLDVSDSKFYGSLRLDHAEIRKESEFVDAILGANSSFFRTRFKDTANFMNSTFSGAVQFCETIFDKDTFFLESTHHGSTNFVDVIFHGVTSFDGSVFYKRLAISYSKFENDLSFVGSRFDGIFKFTSVRLSGISNFKQCSFGNFALITSCIFHNQANFSDATFHNYFPDFDGTSIHSSTTFSASDICWPSIKTKPSLSSIESVGKIRHAIANQGLPEEEHYFFRKEMSFRARRGKFWDRLPYRAFELLSNFGHSIQLPLYWLLTLWCLFSIAYKAILLPNGMRETADLDLLVPLGLSLANTFFLFGSYRFIPDGLFEQASAWLTTLSALQIGISFILLFCLGLALRNRFRLR